MLMNKVGGLKRVREHGPNTTMGKLGSKERGSQKVHMSNKDTWAGRCASSG